MASNASRARIAAVFGIAVAIAHVSSATRAESGPTADRVGFPKNYRTEFTLVRTVDIKEQRKVAAVYANEHAAAIARGGSPPYPNGSIIVMEWRDAVLDATGAPALDAEGRLRPAPEVEHVDVMRRGEGFGEAYGASRSGEWEYAGYRMDGSYTTPPEKSAACAACHLKAGAERDFVYGGK